MAKGISVTQMRMYEDMLQDDFRPVLQAIETHEQILEEIASFEVRKELGVLDLMVREKELELSLKEVRDHIKKLNERQHKDGEYTSPVHRAIKARLASTAEGPIADVRAQHKILLRQVRLAGLPADIKAIFDEMPETLERLSNRVARLPVPKRPKAMIKAAKDKLI